MSVNAIPTYGGDVRLWFSQMEAFFTLSEIQSEEKKLQVLFASMPFPLAAIIKDLINDTPPNASFHSIKEELLRRTSQSAETRFRALINEESLDGRTPSQFLRRMKELAGGEITDGPLFRQLFLSRLPNHVRGTLTIFTKTTPLEELAAAADHILDVMPTTQSQSSSPRYACSCTTAATAISSVSPEMAAQNATVKAMQEIAEQIKNLLSQTNTESRRPRGRGRRNSGSRSASRNRDSSPFSGPPGACWYHRRFGNRATRCTKPCTFPDSGNDQQGI